MFPPPHLMHHSVVHSEFITWLPVVDVVADFGVCIGRSSPPSNAILSSGEYIFHPVHIIAIHPECATWIVTLCIRIYVYQVRLQLKYRHILEATASQYQPSCAIIAVMDAFECNSSSVKEEGICTSPALMNRIPRRWPWLYLGLLFVTGCTWSTWYEFNWAVIIQAKTPERAQGGRSTRSPVADLGLVEFQIGSVSQSSRRLLGTLLHWRMFELPGSPLLCVCLCTTTTQYGVSDSDWAITVTAIAMDVSKLNHWPDHLRHYIEMLRTTST